MNKVAPIAIVLCGLLCFGCGSEETGQGGNGGTGASAGAGGTGGGTGGMDGTGGMNGTGGMDGAGGAAGSGGEGGSGGIPCVTPEMCNPVDDTCFTGFCTTNVCGGDTPTQGICPVATSFCLCMCPDGTRTCDPF